MMVELVAGMELSGLMLFQSVNFSKTSRGSDMARVTLLTEDGTTNTAVVWDDSILGVLKFATIPMQVDAVITVDSYNGGVSCKLVGLNNVYDIVDIGKWYKKLDSQANGNLLLTNLKGVVSEKALALVLKMLNENGREISVAMAAQYGGYHDGVIGGLLNHLRKLVKYGTVAMAEYKDTFTQTERDLVFLGLVLHDMGKLYELKDGAYWEESIVPHTVSGIWFLDKYKDEIIEQYGRMFYLELVAIISQHHGEFGERPKTVYAYLVHVIDLLDSRVSGLQKKLDDGVVGNCYFDEFKLTFNRYE